MSDELREGEIESLPVPKDWAESVRHAVPISGGFRTNWVPNALQRFLVREHDSSAWLQMLSYHAVP